LGLPLRNRKVEPVVRTTAYEQGEAVQDNNTRTMICIFAVDCEQLQRICVSGIDRKHTFDKPS
jgi:hypothetical protein